MKGYRNPRADWRAVLLASVGAAALSAGGAFAQDQEDEDEPAVTPVPTTDEDGATSGDRIVVTGSRLRRDTFSSTAPLQIIDAESIQEAGIVDTAEIFKATTVVQGAQLDTNVNANFVAPGGPGAANISLRGLAADRTLVLINGRRFAPSGVEGAPQLPNVNLIPSSMIERVDILLDGASSVYGSDAVAGVVNVILRDEYEGFNLEAQVNAPQDSGGESFRLSMLMGSSSDSGHFVFGAEYLEQNELLQRERDWTYGLDNNGNLQSCSLDIETGGTPERRCHGFVGNELISNFVFGSVAPILGVGGAEPATTNIGIPGWWDLSTAGVSTRDPRFRDDYYQAEAHMLPHQQRLSVFFSGEQDLNIVDGMTAFVEASFSNQQLFNHGTPGQLFPTVDVSNPFNPGFTSDVIVPVFFSPIPRGDISAEIEQTRLYSGVRGDLGFAGAPNWDYEAFFGYTRSIGISSRPTLNEERLAVSLATSRDDGTGNIICGVDVGDTTFGFGDAFGFLTVEQCVPVNLFAPSLYDPTVNDFATPEERAFLEAIRTVDTLVDQTILGGYITGPLFSLPAGDVQAVLGVEWREDALDSRTDTVAASGLALGFFSDKASAGSVSLTEVYGEVELPLASGQAGFEDLTLNLSGRYVDHELYGTNSVYSVKGNWSPTDWITLRGTYGTSFRAPGLRELFLGGQSGFVSGFSDPCVVPLAARDANNNYDPNLETRSTTTLANCVSEGVDPTSLGVANGTSSIESFRAGNLQLNPEESKSWTVGLVVEPPISNAVDLRFGVNYFDIEVNDAISIPSTTFILRQCYNSSNFPNDPFCQRRVRDAATGFLTSVDRTPFNVSSITSVGIDYNAFVGFDFTAAGRDFTWNTDLVLTNEKENEQTDFSSGNVMNFTGDFGSPEWRGTLNSRLLTGDFTFFWRTRYIGEQTNKGLFGSLTPTVENGGTPVVSVDEYYVHDFSINWERDTVALSLGLQNVFDEDPPQVDQDVSDFTSGGWNVPLGVGYDILGRTVFVNVSKSF